MIKILASKDFYYRGEYILKDEEIKNLPFESIVALNEKGFIQPLSTKELIIIKRELKKEENNGTTI